MNIKERLLGFGAGISTMLNLLALGILIFPLGLPVEVVRWVAVGVILIDAVVELFVFFRK